MAINKNSQVPYQSSGIYFTETDLTVVAQTTGGFSAAAVGLTEKGPAFQIVNSATFEERAQKLGGLNQQYPTSFYARQYLEQARNYKEIRILGLEGYKDTHGWAIAYNDGITGNAVPTFSGNTQLTPLVLGKGALVGVLKERPTNLTGRPSISTLTIGTATQPDSGSSATTEQLFSINITYSDSTTDTIICSLRPDSKDYIVNKIWDMPFKRGKDGSNIYPLVKNQICPVWVDYLVPSTPTIPAIGYSRGYYAPGTTTSIPAIGLLEGDTRFGTNFVYGNPITLVGGSIAQKISGGNVIGTTVTVNSDATSLNASSGISTVTISGVTGTNAGLLNQTFAISTAVFASSQTTFDLYDYTSSVAAGTLTNPIILPNTDVNTLTSAKVNKYFIPTWESELLNFDSVTYQTPITPWFVSDFDSMGDFKKLFRFWAISDGEDANIETKIEIANLNPTSNSSAGGFDVIVRQWDDREDLSQIKYEYFSNLCLDPNSDNYILKRIGDGEDFSLRSNYIFVEMNTSEQLESNLMPYGVLGYPNTTGQTFCDVSWTADYDQTKPLTKQSLGLTNNIINTAKQVQAGQLKFKNIADGTIGLGFHLNPNNNATAATIQSSVFTFANQAIYKDSKGLAIIPAEKVKRSRFVVDFYGGFDGFNIYNNRAWGDTTSLDYSALQIALNKLSDKESLTADFTVLVTPDFYLDSDASACEAVLDMVLTRGDCLYLPDLNYDAESDPQVASDLVLNSNIRSNSSAVYFPWLQIENAPAKNNVWMPPSLLALGTISYVAQNEQVWQPPGGAIRTVTNNLVRSRRRLLINDREVLKQVNINPITEFPGSGYEITEVRTTQEVFSALSFIHNRLLLCYAKKVLNQTLRPLLFQLSTDVTKNAFLATVTPIFDRIKKLNGVEEYKVEVLDSPIANDRTTLYGRITIVPLYPVERIIVDFTLADSAISFNA